MLLVCILLLALPLCVAVYRRFFHALSRVPGPPLAAVSGLWYAYQVRQGRLLPLAKRLHRRYGHAVRVGPNAVWFDSAEAFQLIYHPSQGFPKSDFYLATALFRPSVSWRAPLHITAPDTLDLLSDRDVDRYRRQRRLIGPVYRATNMPQFAGAVDVVLDRAIDALRSRAGVSLDLCEWMHMVAVECLAAVVLSWSPGFLRGGSDYGSGHAAYYNWRRKSVFGLFPALVVADLHARWVSRVFAAVWQLGYVRRADYRPLFAAVGQRVAARIKTARVWKNTQPKKAGAKAKKHSVKPSAPPDLMADLVQLHLAKPAFSETYLRRLAVTNFGAGHETLCSALTAVVGMLGTHPAEFRRVAAEVRTAGAAADQVVDAHSARRHLPHTWAAIREAQRLHPALGMALPRTATALFVADGHYIPVGTTVGCCPAALHRNATLFGHDADVFRPDRWLAADAQTLRQMERCNLTWGGGARTCPGRFLAELVLHRAVVALVRDFEIHAALPPATRMPSYFVAMLRGVDAEFRPVTVSAEGVETAVEPVEVMGKAG